jgi:hypothetical protein
MRERLKLTRVVDLISGYQQNWKTGHLEAMVKHLLTHLKFHCRLRSVRFRASGKMPKERPRQLQNSFFRVHEKKASHTAQE